MLMVIGGILLAIAAVVGIITYFALMIMFWVFVGAFALFTFGWAYVLHDPYLGFFAAIPTTLLFVWIISSVLEDSGKK